MKTATMHTPLLKQWCAWAPLALSLSAIMLVLGHSALSGIVREEVERTLAHIFVALMVMQIPVVLFFAVRWMPERPLEVISLLAVQGGGWIAAITAAYFLT